jgi:hypothetical protein
MPDTATGGNDPEQLFSFPEDPLSAAALTGGYIPSLSLSTSSASTRAGFLSRS